MGSPAIPERYADRATLSREEAALTLGKSLDFVDALISDGNLKTVKLRTSILVIAYDLWRLLGLVKEDAGLRMIGEPDSLLDRLERRIAGRG